MSPIKKTGKKAGTLHRKTRQHPVRQGDSGNGEAPHRLDKPDFDEKDKGISPKRKAPGPSKRRRGSLPVSSAEPSPPPSPEARIKQDDNDSK